MSNSYLQPSNIHTPQPPRKGRLVGQKPPLKPKEVWSIRIRLQILGKTRDLALFNLAIDSKLRSCDLMALRVSDVFVSGSVKERTVIVQQKTGRPVQFELTEQTREAVDVWITRHALVDGGYLFPSRVHDCLHLSTRKYARIPEDDQNVLFSDIYEPGAGQLPSIRSEYSHRRKHAAFACY